MDARLENCQALRELTPEERESIASLGVEVRVEPGEAFIREGVAESSFYLLLSGRAEVRRDAQPVAVVESGAVLGEMALFNASRRTSEVRALEPCQLLRISTAPFCRMLVHDNPAAVKLMQALGRTMVERLQDTEEQLLAHASAASPELAHAVAEAVLLRERLIKDWALRYHSIGKEGKLCIVASKPVGTAADLSVAYSPGVAEPCLAIAEEPDRSYEYTSRGHLVGVITNGTAVLGLGNIGALAAKPVMEGKAVLFKRFADVDAFDLEVNEPDPERLIDVVCAVAPTFGGINLEDIRAPECFHIERECQRRLDIPVFHDDQHGTAIIAGAGLVNALELVGKRIDEVRVVFSGAGAAGFATAKYFLRLGVRKENLLLTDKNGVVYKGRGDGNYLDELACNTPKRTLREAIRGADVFVGVSAPNLVTPEMLLSMNRSPIVFALANPVPEIDYPDAVQTRSDVIMATGRSDYPNQINNVIAFPFLFRGALDTRSRRISREMMLAATRAIAGLAKEPVTEEASIEPDGAIFGPEYLIPRPFDRRLLTRVTVAVAKAAIESGVARLHLDLDEYHEQLTRLQPEAPLG